MSCFGRVRADGTSKVFLENLENVGNTRYWQTWVQRRTF